MGDALSEAGGSKCYGRVADWLIVARHAARVVARPGFGAVRRQLSRRRDRAAAGRPADAARPLGLRLLRWDSGARDLVPLVSYLARAAAAAAAEPGSARSIRRSSSPRSRSRSRPRRCCPAGCCGRASALGWTLLALAAIDLRQFLLPDVLTLPLIPAGLAVAWMVDPGLLAGHCARRARRLCGLRRDRWRLPPAARPRRARARRRQAAGGSRRLARLAGAAERRGDRAASGLALALASALGGAKLAWTSRLAFGPHLALAFWLVWLFGPVVIG